MGHSDSNTVRPTSSSSTVLKCVIGMFTTLTATIARLCMGIQSDSSLSRLALTVATLAIFTKLIYYTNSQVRQLKFLLPIRSYSIPIGLGLVVFSFRTLKPMMLLMYHMVYYSLSKTKIPAPTLIRNLATYFCGPNTNLDLTFLKSFCNIII